MTFRTVLTGGQFLQSTHERGEWIDYWAEEQFFDAVFQPYFDVMGESVFAMFVFGTCILGIYSWTESPMQTGIVTVLLGGLAIASLPPPAARIVVIAATLVLAIALYAVWGRR